MNEFFAYDGSGVMPGRTWVIAPDRQSLDDRWKRLVAESDPAKREILFHPHGSDGELGDRHTGKVLSEGLPGQEHRALPIAKDKGAVFKPIHYGFRSFDRQWIIPDNRLLNRPNPRLWESYSTKQVFLTALMRHSPLGGPAVTFTALIPDHDHYRGSFAGRVFPLWADAAGAIPNVQSRLLLEMTTILGISVQAEDILAYLAAVSAHPAYLDRFGVDLKQPGLRIPVTADPRLFMEAVQLGCEVIWLHTFGERFASPKDARPASAPRLPIGERPQVPDGGTIPSAADAMPEAMSYDPATKRLHVGAGYVDNVPPEVWAYEVSGKQVVTQWFSYRGRDRSRPIIGDRRPPSPLGDIQPAGWLAEYTTELLNVLNVLGRLVKLEPKQADLLDRICAGKTIPAATLREAIAAGRPSPAKRKSAKGHSNRQSDWLA